MSIDQKITDAIRGAVASAGQPEAVALRLVAWFESLAEGNERLEDPDSVERHFDLLFQATVVPGADRDGEPE